MQSILHYPSPLGDLLLAADEEGIVGLWFDNAKYYASRLEQAHQVGSTPILEEGKRWLDIYFSGREPQFQPALHLIGSSFQRAVWQILLQIPYGKTMTYGEIAAQIAVQRGLARMSAQAVGGAVGRNPIGIMVPCHRVVGADGSLTGYAGGLEKKAYLLQLEGITRKK